MKIKILHNKYAKIIIMFYVLCICIFGFSFYKRFYSKDFYSINPRVNEIAKNDNPFSEDFKTVGWIQVQGTNIDYPILYNSLYEYPGEFEKYAKMVYYSPGFHNNFEVSGHNIFNLSSNPLMKQKDFTRFEELMNFVYYDFAKDNLYIQLTYEGEEYVYKIFMAGLIPLINVQKYRPITDLNETFMNEYLEELKKYNMYQYDVDVSSNDNLISLSTCTRFYGNNMDWKFYVVGRKLRDNEKIDHYSVLKNSVVYKDIEKILKGDESNEKI